MKFMGVASVAGWEKQYAFVWGSANPHAYSAWVRLGELAVSMYSKNSVSMISVKKVKRANADATGKRLNALEIWLGYFLKASNICSKYKISCPGAEAGVANDLLLFQAPDGEECLVGKGNRIVAGVNNCARWFFLIPSIVFYTVIFHFYGEP